MAETGAIQRATDHEEIAPLIELCKAGRLFDVQAWIKAGRPVNPPPPPAKGTQAKSPLEYAIDRGFHSLVEVLLEGGAVQEPEGYDAPIYQALRARRFDIVQLLVEHGFDPASIEMDRVFHTWDPKLMEYFIERGAEIREGEPFADALCERIRTALGVYMRCRERFPELQEQAETALRHHCKEGNLKWVSLMLWAGADPFKPGPSEPGEELDEDEDDEEVSAVGWAALYGNYGVFKLKPIRTRLPSPGAAKYLKYLTKDEGIEVLERLLTQGVSPNDLPNGGCSAIRWCLHHMSWSWGLRRVVWGLGSDKEPVDNHDSREQLKAIHVLAKHGAKWVPEDKEEIDSTRRSLLKLRPDYTVEFVWIMSRYRGCTREHIEQLLRTPTIKRHTADHQPRLQELLATWE